MGQCCVFRQLHTDLATILVLESRATAPLPPKAVEDGGSRARRARCLLGALMRTFMFCGARIRVPGYSPRARIESSRRDRLHFRDLRTLC